MADSGMTGWNGKGAAKRVMIAGASGAAYILVSDQLVKDRWADSEDKELWRGGAQLAGALVIGKGLSKYNRDAALGVAVGGSARGLYRIAQHFGIDETVDRWFSTDDSSSSSCRARRARRAATSTRRRAKRWCSRASRGGSSRGAGEGLRG